jgi:hypothetical protein
VSDVTELTSGPITASRDGITAQLIRPDRQNQRDHDRLASCGKQVLILEAGVNYSYSVAAPNTRLERRS